jgi:chaperonin GroES
MAQLIPLDDHVIIKPLEDEQTTASGIIVSSEKKEKPTKGTVIAVGPGENDEDGERIPMDVAVDDVVYFTAYAPDEVELDGETFLVIKSSSLLAKIA